MIDEKCVLQTCTHTHSLKWQRSNRYRNRLKALIRAWKYVRSKNNIDLFTKFTVHTSSPSTTASQHPCTVVQCHIKKHFGTSASPSVRECKLQFTWITNKRNEEYTAMYSISLPSMCEADEYRRVVCMFRACTTQRRKLQTGLVDSMKP